MAIILSHMVSLDGYMESPATYQGPNWATTDDELLAHFLEVEHQTRVHVYGRRVYEAVADWWPRAAEDASLPAPLVAYGREWVKKPKVVVSRTLERVGPNTRIVRADPGREVADLASRGDGDVAVYGGALAASLRADGLVDEVRCYVNPAVLGSGTPLFQDVAPVLRLRLLEARPFSCGVVLLRYSTAADPARG